MDQGQISIYTAVKGRRGRFELLALFRKCKKRKWSKFAHRGNGDRGRR